MKETLWNDDWLFFKEGGERRAVCLPHDAMLYEERKAEYGNASGYYPGGKYFYEKKLFADAGLCASVVKLRFEGIYMRSFVYLNGEHVGGHVYGYTVFFVDLTGRLREGENTILVEVDNSLFPNARWYTGSGIYRDVYLCTAVGSYILPDGVYVETVSLSPAKIRVRTEIAGSGTLSLRVYRKGLCVAEGDGAEALLQIENAELWSADSPALYELRVQLTDGASVCDESSLRFGVRMLQWDTERGLTVNGKSVKLAGGCIHHDNGLLGAREFAKAARRKIAKLKAFGFNAVRYSHYPMSRVMLDVCDELGMYVFDESFDQWRIPQSKYDYAIDFEREWRGDIDALVRKDRSHACVILYGIGNEITDAALPHGGAIARALTERVKAADRSRPVCIANNGLMAVMTDELSKKGGQGATSGDVNEVLVMLKKAAELLTAERLEAVCGETHAAVDIVGYNYAHSVYEETHALAPERVILGSETFPSRLAKEWEEIKRLPYVIGEFIWTAWDYIGEAGVGLACYGSDSAPFSKPYPCKLAACGSFDITGMPETSAYYAALVFGARTQPYIAVRPVDHSGEPYALGNWRLTDALHSWSWTGQEGKPADIEVYAHGASVALFLNGDLLGKHSVEGCVARFTTTYRQGILEAVCYAEDGSEIGRDVLVSAGGALQLTAEAEEPCVRRGEITWVNAWLTDERAVPKMLCDLEVRVRVEGGELLAVGSADPLSEYNYTSDRYNTYYGHIQAIVKGGGESGNLRIYFAADGLKDAVVNIQVT